MGSPVPKIVQWFKTMSTNEYIRQVKSNNWTPFEKRLWQRNYWERVIRNEKELENISTYIQNNALKWNEDSLNLVSQINIGASRKSHKPKTNTA